MNRHFERLYAYNEWANDLFTKTLTGHNFQNPKIGLLYSHIGTAQLIWMNRIRPIDQKIPGVFEEMPIDKASKMLKIGNNLWIDYLATGPDLDQVIHYTSTKGVQYSSALTDILTHVANHGTHHRGQIATLLRQENIAPPPSDFIFFSRK